MIGQVSERLGFGRGFKRCILLASGMLATILVGGAAASPASDALERGDFARAEAEWKPAAERGDPAAEFGLGQALERGQGDYLAAARWYRKAAEQGSQPAKYRLALLYLTGNQQFAPNTAKGYMWLLLATSGDAPDPMSAELRRLVEAHISGQDQAAGQREMEAWQRNSRPAKPAGVPPVAALPPPVVPAMPPPMAAPPQPLPVQPPPQAAPPLPQPVPPQAAAPAVPPQLPPPLPAPPQPPAPTPTPMPPAQAAVPSPPPAAPAVPPSPAPQPREPEQQVAVVPPPAMPAPVKPFDLSEELQKMPCSALKLVAVPGGGRVIEGTIPGDNIRARLDKLLEQMPPSERPQLALDILKPPLCRSLGVYNEMRRVGLVFDDGIEAEIPGGSGVQREGTALQVKVKARTNYPIEVRIDYFMLDGSVLHMWPNPDLPKAEIKPDQTLVFNKRDLQGRGWEISGPFGTEFIAVTATPKLLDLGLRPQVEDAGDYMRDLQAALRKQVIPPEQSNEVATLIIHTAPR